MRPGAVSIEAVARASLSRAVSNFTLSAPIQGIEVTVPLNEADVAQQVVGQSVLGLGQGDINSITTSLMLSGPSVTNMSVFSYHMGTIVGDAGLPTADQSAAGGYPTLDNMGVAMDQAPYHPAWPKIAVLQGKETSAANEVSFMVGPDISEAVASISVVGGASQLGTLARTSTQAYDGRIFYNAAACLTKIPTKSGSAVTFYYRALANMMATTMIAGPDALASWGGPLALEECGVAGGGTSKMLFTPSVAASCIRQNMNNGSSILVCLSQDTSSSCGETWTHPQFRIVPPQAAAAPGRAIGQVEIGFRVFAITADAYLALTAGRANRLTGSGAVSLQPAGAAVSPAATVDLSTSWRVLCQNYTANVPYPMSKSPATNYYDLGGWGDVFNPDGTAICAPPRELLETYGPSGIGRLQAYMFAVALPVCPAARLASIIDPNPAVGTTSTANMIYASDVSTRARLLVRNKLADVVDSNRCASVLLVVPSYGPDGTPPVITIAAGDGPSATPLNVPVWGVSEILNAVQYNAAGGMTVLTPLPVAVMALRQSIFYNNNGGYNRNDILPAGYSSRSCFVATDPEVLSANTPLPYLLDAFGSTKGLQAAYVLLSETGYTASLRPSYHLGRPRPLMRETPVVGGPALWNPTLSTVAGFGPLMTNCNNSMSGNYLAIGGSPAATGVTDQVGRQIGGHVHTYGSRPMGYRAYDGVYAAFAISTTDNVSTNDSSLPDPYNQALNYNHSGRNVGDDYDVDNISLSQRPELSPLGVPLAGSYKMFEGRSFWLRSFNDSDFQLQKWNWDCSALDMALAPCKFRQSLNWILPGAGPPWTTGPTLSYCPNPVDPIVLQTTHYVPYMDPTLQVLRAMRLLTISSDPPARGGSLPDYGRSYLTEASLLYNMACEMYDGVSSIAAQLSMSAELASNRQLYSTLVERYTAFAQLAAAAMPGSAAAWRTSVQTVANAMPTTLLNMLTEQADAYSRSVCSRATMSTGGLISISGSAPFNGTFYHCQQPGLYSFVNATSYGGTGRTFDGYRIGAPYTWVQTRLGPWATKIVDDASMMISGLLPYFPPIRFATYEGMMRTQNLAVERFTHAYLPSDQLATSASFATGSPLTIMNYPEQRQLVLPVPIQPGGAGSNLVAWMTLPASQGVRSFSVSSGPRDGGKYMPVRDQLSRTSRIAALTGCYSNMYAMLAYEMAKGPLGGGGTLYVYGAALPSPFPLDVLSGGSSPTSYLYYLQSQNGPAQSQAIRTHEVDLTPQNWRIYADVVLTETGTIGPYRAIGASVAPGSALFGTGLDITTLLLPFGRTLPQGFTCYSTLGGVKLAYTTSNILITAPDPSKPLADIRMGPVTTLQTGNAVEFGYAGLAGTDFA